MDIVGLGYIGLRTPRYKAWAAYGTDVLGMCRWEGGDDDSVYLKMDDRRWRIAIHPGAANEVAYIGWEVKHRPAFERAVEKLHASGVDVTPSEQTLADQRGVRQVARFTDPAGYPHELFYGHEYTDGSFVPSRPMKGFMAGTLGLGHATFSVPDPAMMPEIRHLAENILGFTWTGQGALPVGTAAFYSPKLNPRSHSIAWVVAPNQHGVRHLGIEVKALDDVGRAYDAALDHGVPLHRTIGRHSLDPVISFYMFTPSGTQLEYLTGGSDYDNPYVGDRFTELNTKDFAVWGLKLVNPHPPEEWPEG